jgi:hypothetical protein
VFNLKVDRQLNREYFTSDAIYNGSAGMTLYYYMCRSWYDCCRRGESPSWLSVIVELVDSEWWCLNNAIFYAFIMRIKKKKRVFILESYLKTMSYTHCKQGFFEKFSFSQNHVSQPYVTVGLIILQYNFNFDFLETNILLKRNWLDNMIHFQVLLKS